MTEHNQMNTKLSNDQDMDEQRMYSRTNEYIIYKHGATVTSEWTHLYDRRYRI